MLSGAVSMKSVSTLSSMRSTSSTKPGASFHWSQVSILSEDRQQTAVRSLPRWSMPVGRVISLHRLEVLTLQAQLPLVLGQRPVHRVDVQDIGLAGLQPGFQDALPELAGIDFAQHFAVLGAFQAEHRVVLHRQHEFVGDVDAVMQVEALAVEIAAGLADFQELLDLRMGDVEIDRRRAAPQRALAKSPGSARPSHG